MAASLMYVAETQEATFVAVEGKGLRRQSEYLRATFEKSIKDTPTRKFIVVLEGCDYLDSTFLGNLVQMTKRQRGRQQAPFEIIADQRAAERLFATCNLQHYLPIEQTPSVCVPDRWQPVDPHPTGDECSYHQMESHECLGELDIPDAESFKRIAESMRRELRARDT